MDDDLKTQENIPPSEACAGRLQKPIGDSSLTLGRASVIYLSLAFTLTFYHAQTINRKFWQPRQEFHQSIIQGDFKAPYQYRLTAPWLAEVGGWMIEQTLGLKGDKQKSLAREIVYVGQRLLATWLLLILIHVYHRTWFSPGIAFGGALLVGALHFFTYHSYFYQPSSCLNLLILAAGVCLLMRGSLGWIYVLMALGSVTRETSGLLLLFYVAHQWRQPGWLKHAVGLLLVWALPQVLMRLGFGLQPSFPERPIAEQFPHVLWPMALFSLMWVIPILKFRRLPPFLARALIFVVPPLLVTNFLFGKLEETRLFLDLVLILVPATLFALLYDSDEMAGESNLSMRGKT